MLFLMKKLDQAAWYAIYTSPRAEKKIQDRLTANGIEVYLPLQRQLRQWSDRKKWVEAPLIPSYLFVNIVDVQRLAVLQVPGVVRFVTLEGKPAQIKPEELDWIRRLLQAKVEIEVSSAPFIPGDLVEVQSGQLIGFRGELVEYQSEKKVILRLIHLGQSLVVKIAPALLRKVPGQYPNSY